MAKEEDQDQKEIAPNTVPARFRPTEEELKAYAGKGAELLMNATQEDLGAYSEYTGKTD